TSVEWVGRELEEHADRMRPAADRWYERDLVARGDDYVPIGELLVDGGAHRFAVGVQGGVQLLERVVHVVHGRARLHLDRLGISARLLAQPREEPRPYRDRYGHQPILERRIRAI